MGDSAWKNTCRLCNGAALEHTLHLVGTPPANEFLKSPLDTGSYPLDLNTCTQCGHVQLSVVMDPVRLFSNYVYVSGTSPVFVNHFREYADTVASNYDLRPNDLVVEIGSNDGTLLRFFQEKKARVVGVDPAAKIASDANSSGIATIPEFFNKESVKYIRERIHRWAHVVVANNVMAHIDDLREVVLNVRDLIHPQGIFVFEVSYLVDVLKDCLFDTIYHEHLSYHLVKPLVSFFEGMCMRLVDVERVPTHGGSIRCYVSPRALEPSPRVQAFCDEETALGLYDHDRLAPVWVEFSKKIARSRELVIGHLQKLKASGKRAVGYGAPAKATTLMYQFGIDKSLIEYIVDDSPLKCGLYSPGKGIPVVSSDALKENRPDCIIIFAWNFADSIVKKLDWYRDAGGKVIVPFPEFTEI